MNQKLFKNIHLPFRGGLENTVGTAKAMQRLGNFIFQKPPNKLSNVKNKIEI